MEVHEPNESERKKFNEKITHALQSWEWGEFRKKTGVKVLRRIFIKNGKVTQVFQVTIHRIPRTKFTIGYLPRCTMPDPDIFKELAKIGKQENCIFIKLEPNIEKDQEEIWTEVIRNRSIKLSSHPMFTDHAFQLDLTRSEDELLKNMHPKTRYNIRVAEKHGVEIVEDNSDNAFEHYIRLMKETTIRQRYYAHGEKYHRTMWETLKIQNSELKVQNDNSKLTAHLFLAKYKGVALAAWILFIVNDKLYYPYGTSSREHREVMASNLLMWEAIKFGKKMSCRIFDMWGALGENPDPKHPWYGFHKFKQGYGPRLVEFVGSYDLVLNPILYQFYNLGNKARWLYLRLKRG